MGPEGTTGCAAVTLLNHLWDQTWPACKIQGVVNVDSLILVVFCPPLLAVTWVVSTVPWHFGVWRLLCCYWAPHLSSQHPTTGAVQVGPPARCCLSTAHLPRDTVFQQRHINDFSSRKRRKLSSEVSSSESPRGREPSHGAEISRKYCGCYSVAVLWPGGRLVAPRDHFLAAKLRT